MAAYWRSNAGSIVTAFALSLPVVVGSVGMSLDMGQAYLVRQRLGAALDASALAGAAMATDEEEIRARVDEFFALNYPEEKIGTAYDLAVEVDGDEIIVSASADFNTAFMRVLGIRTFTVSQQTVVVREVRGLEVALVLDVTTSMNTDNNIAALREAADNFVEILFERSNDPEAVKIALVPYSSSVNVGPYGVGLTPEGDDFEDGEDTGRGFVVDWAGNDLSPDLYTSNYNTNAPYWYGCVVEANDDGWDDGDSQNDPYPNDVIKLREDEDPLLRIVDHEGPWLPYMYENYGQNSTYCGQTCTGSGWRRRCTTNTCHYPRNPPSYYCPRTVVVPLTSDEDQLQDAIDTLTPHGYTLGNYGMTWGFRMLSPEFPFQQGAAWDDPEWRKVIIMMTDGDNTMEQNYTAYWRTRRHIIEPQDLNERFAETCETMKTVKGVLIYTITFANGLDPETKDYYRNCATTPAQYYDAPSQEELIDVFENISRELANLHIRS